MEELAVNIERAVPIVVFSCLAAVIPSLAAEEASTAIETREKGQYVSPIPKYIFADTLEAQEAQLKNNPLMLELAKSRAWLASDPYRPTYHFVSPHKIMNDPNGLTFWKGRWHLFYQSVPESETLLGGQLHWGHAVSDNLVHWRDLPYAIYPGIESGALSGSTLVEEDRVIAMYPGRNAGQMVAVSRDPLLLNWEKTGPVFSGKLFADFWDADIWKEEETYVGLSGGSREYYPESTVPPEKRGGASHMYGKAGVWPKFELWTSKDLKDWKRAGELLFENTPFTDRYDDGSCPNFLKIGDKHIMLYFSHGYGGQYLLGDYDLNVRKFRPYDHGRFNHGQVMPGGVHAPSASEDGKGGVIAIFNVNEMMKDAEWKDFRLDRIMSLPQRLTLGEDKRLRMEPVAAIETLRGAHRRIGETVISGGQEIVFKDIRGNAMELSVEIDPKESQWVQLNVLRSPDAEEQTSITFYNLQTPEGLYLDGRISEEVILDGSRSTTLKNIRLRSPEKALVKRGDEPLKLRVFIDRSVVEVFVNERQYLGTRVYPGRKDSLGVSLRAHGQEAVLKKLDAWQMKSIWRQEQPTQ